MERFISLPDAGRGMGIHVMASKGAGKSRLMGRFIAFQDFLRGVPQVLIDPHGPICDNLLDKITRCEPGLQATLWQRIRYVDMSGKHGSIVPFPIYYRLGRESLATIASRFPEAIIRLNPELNRAPVAGANAIRRVAVPTGMILFSLGLQITDAPDLLSNPEPYLRQAEGKPETAPAIQFFRSEYLRLPLREQQNLIGSFLRKIAPFQYDSAQQAMFAGTTAGIDWREVVDKRLTVLIDMRHEHERERIQFKMYWALQSLLEWIKVRGAGRHVPLGLMIDELTYLVEGSGAYSELMSADLQELIERIARNMAIWLTTAHQELHQFPESLQHTLMTMGTQLLGSTTNLKTAISLAERYYPYCPDMIRRFDPVYSTYYGERTQVDERPVYFTRDEQLHLAATHFMDLPKFTFLAAVAREEGSIPTSLTQLSIRRLDPGQYVNQSLCDRARVQLVKRDGQAVDAVLAEITTRQQPLLHPVQPAIGQPGGEQAVQAALVTEPSRIQRRATPRSAPG